MRLLLAALFLLAFAAPAAAQQAQVTDRTETSVTVKYTGLAAGTDYVAELFSGGALRLSTPFSTVATPPPPPPPPTGERWVPEKSSTFYWQLQGTLAARSANYQVIDIDGFDTSATQVASLAAQGKKTVCYISVGTWEDWRPDQGQFPTAAKGSQNGWPGERWIDTRNATVRSIMASRIQMCADKGFDGVEFDNQDGYTNSTGFPLTGATQLDYNRFLAATAHSVGLAAVLKNDVDQVGQLVGDYDAALNEQCAQYSECGVYAPFLQANKPVWQVEYGTKNSSRCSSANAAGRKAYYAGLNLSASTRWDPC